MKKNQVAAMVLASIVAASVVPAPVFAEEPPVEDTASFSTASAFELTTSTKSTVYAGQKNLFVAAFVTVTNDSSNPGSIKFQIVNQKGTTIVTTKTIAPGYSSTVMIPSGLGANYEVQAWAASVDGAYNITVK